MAIGADGMWSPLRKALGASEPGYLGEWHAFRQYFTNVSDAAASQLWVWFDADLLPGYAWSFPLADGRANVGFGIARGGSISTQAMKQLWPELLTRPHVRKVLGDDAEPEAPHKAWPIPARIGSLPLSRGRALFVGDATGATDLLTGEGIGQALLTGMLAADAILNTNGADASVTAERYERAVTTPPRRGPPHVRRARPHPVLPEGRPRRRSASPARPRGPGRTSPVGCSRTNRGRSCSRRGAGTGASWIATAPSPDRQPTDPRHSLRRHRRETRPL